MILFDKSLVQSSSKNLDETSDFSFEIKVTLLEIHIVSFLDNFQIISVHFKQEDSDFSNPTYVHA